MNILTDNNNRITFHPEILCIKEMGHKIIPSSLIAGDYAVCDSKLFEEYMRTIRQESYSRSLKKEDKAVEDKQLQKIDTAGMIKVSVDTKNSVTELYKNLLTVDKHRFRRELMRARNTHIRMFILTVSDRYNEPEDLKKYGYKNHAGAEYGECLYDEICRLRLIYGAEFLFCRKEDLPERIISLLKLAYES